MEHHRRRPPLLESMNQAAQSAAAHRLTRRGSGTESSSAAERASGLSSPTRSSGDASSTTSARPPTRRSRCLTALAERTRSMPYTASGGSARRWLSASTAATTSLRSPWTSLKRVAARGGDALRAASAPAPSCRSASQARSCPGVRSRSPGGPDIGASVFKKSRAGSTSKPLPPRGGTVRAPGPRAEAAITGNTPLQRLCNKDNH
jgi:hypothetical protein